MLKVLSIPSRIVLGRSSSDIEDLDFDFENCGSEEQDEDEIVNESGEIIDKEYTSDEELEKRRSFLL